MSEPQILEGDLQSFDLPQVLKTLAIRRATGILTVQGEDDIVAISCLNGHIVTADSLNQTQEESLGELLVSQGLVAKGDYDAVVMEHQGSGGSVGELLVSRSLISREKLLECLRLQTYQLMLQVLVWRVGEFKFYGGDEVSYEKGVTPISVEELLMRALADLGEQSGIGGEVPKLDAIYRPVPPRGAIKILGRDGPGELESGGPGIWITDVQQAFLERMDSKTTAFDIARALGAGRFRTLFSLHQLIQSDLVEMEAAIARQVGTATPPPGGLAPQGMSPVASGPTVVGSSPDISGTLTLNPPSLVSSQAPLSQVPPSQAPPSQAPPSQVPPSQVPPSQVPPSQVPPSQAPLSQAPLSQVPYQPQKSGHVDRPSSVAGTAEASGSFDSSRYDLDDDRTVVNVPINPRPWVGVGLAAILLVALLSAFIERPITYLFPFPWQAVQQSEAERLMVETLFHKIDGAIGAYYLMDFKYPRSLEELVSRGLLTAADIEDPKGGMLKYSSTDDSYRIEISDAGGVQNERIRSMRGDFSRDLDLFPTDLIKNPLELLD